MPPIKTRRLDGDLDAARLRMIRMTEIAVKVLDAEGLNVLSVTISAHLIGKLGSQAQKMLDDISAELDSEHAKDWTLRLKNVPWGKA